MSPVFPYDSSILAALQNQPQNIPDVLQTLRAVDNLCINEDGLKWFNGLYLTVTEAVENRVNDGTFTAPAWLAELDVQFASLYFEALRVALTGAPCPGCWQAMFTVRGNIQLTRIQFALAGMNAHINHDLCLAINSTSKIAGTVPQHGTVQYFDYTSINPVLDGLIEQAKQTLNVRLSGDSLPPVSHLEDLIAAWNVCAARENAWRNAEHLWNLPAMLASGLIGTIDGFSTVIGKALLVPIP
jgi:hypothetical protein